MASVCVPGSVSPHLPLQGLLPMYDTCDIAASRGRLTGPQRQRSLPLVIRSRQAEKADPRDSREENGYSNLPPLHNSKDLFYSPLISGP